MKVKLPYPQILINFFFKVIITTNIWKKFGIVNGCQGTVVDIIYKSLGDELPDLPLLIILRLNSYTGPQCFSDQELHNCLPIDTTAAYSNKHHATRTQFPIRLAYAMTVHKSQGETMKKGIVDLGFSERNLGSSYVQITRFKKFTEFLLIPFSFDRITTKRKQ